MSLFEINDKGSWITEKPGHIHDTFLEKCLVEFLPGQTVFDFGCGNASYLKVLQKVCPEVNGCDGNPFTKELTEGIGFTSDLSQPQYFNQYDWVLSFEVGEHLPKEYEDTFIDNLCRHAKKGIILSWAFPGQPGEGHINCQSSEYIIQKLYQKGFLVDYFKSNEFRNNAETWWFQANLLVFYNINNLK